jgi:hypothetical protein
VEEKGPKGIAGFKYKGVWKAIKLNYINSVTLEI